MHDRRDPQTRRLSLLIVPLSLVLAATALGAWAAAATAADASPAAAASTAPATSASAPSSPSSTALPEPAATPAETLCESASDLRLIIGFLGETSLSEDGIVPATVGVIAALYEARTLAGLVDASYRPLVDDLIASLQEVRPTLDELKEQETLGAGIVSIGEAITAIGVATDELSVALREPCPTLEGADA